MSFFNRHKKELHYEYTPDKKTPISSCIDDNIAVIKELFKDANDMVFRDFNIGGPDGTHMFLVFIDGMANNDRINGDVVEPLMISVREVEPSYSDIKKHLYEVIKSSAMAASDFKEIDILEDALTQVLSGDTAMFIDGYTKAIIISTKSWPSRGPDEPSGEMVLRGPRDGFVESLRSNTALIRRRIRDVRLKVKQSQCGVRSKTDIALMYIDDIVDKKALESVENRLKNIQIDAILESGYIEQFIDERKISPFPRVQATERPDVVAAALYEGRIGIIVDNSPFALIVPATLNTMLQSAEDYYLRPCIMTIIRHIRNLAFILSLTAPSLYIALISYNPEIIPNKLLISIAKTREGVPFPAFIEAMIMVVTFELLREAGVRLPKPIGSTIGIVGGIVIGQAAVEAGIVSPIMVIVVAITAISSFALPNYELSIAIRFFRFIMMIAASIYGLYGVMLVVIGLLIHLVKIKSFGVSYLSPIAPLSIKDLKDTMFVRSPWERMRIRPEEYNSADRIRQGGDNNEK